MSRRQDQRSANRKLARVLLLVSVGMFGFGFALWPLYDVFCDLTGLGGRGVSVAESGTTATAIIDRKVTILFDATVNSALPWQFEPAQKTLTVQLGDVSQALYLAFNNSDEAVTGHAIYNVAPPEASLYFVKTECFCFTEQTLKQGETREMPVTFFVQPDLPESIKTITLSYTFFRDGQLDYQVADNHDLKAN